MRGAGTAQLPTLDDQLRRFVQCTWKEFMFEYQKALLATLQEVL